MWLSARWIFNISESHKKENRKGPHYSRSWHLALQGIIAVQSSYRQPYHWSENPDESSRKENERLIIYYMGCMGWVGQSLKGITAQPGQPSPPNCAWRLDQIRVDRFMALLCTATSRDVLQVEFCSNRQEVFFVRCENVHVQYTVRRTLASDTR